jgi:hypothetical protein
VGPRKVDRTRIVKFEGEYIVKAWDEKGVRFPEADYFASDKSDAEQTAKRMKQ